MTNHEVLTRIGWLWVTAAFVGLGLMWLSLPVGALVIGMGSGGLVTVIFVREGL